MDQEESYGSESSNSEAENIDPIFDAVAKSDSGAIKTLLGESPERLHQLNTQNHSPLYEAITNSDLESCQVLLELGADVTRVTDSESYTALHVASHEDVHLKILAYLLTHGRSKELINTVNEFADTAIHRALETPDFYDDDVRLKELNSEQVQKAKVLFDAGADVNLTNLEGDTPLFMIARVEKLIGGTKEDDGVDDITALIKDLLAASSGLTNRNARGYDIIHIGAQNKHPVVLETLLKHPTIRNLPVNSRDNFFRTPLERAIDFPDPWDDCKTRKVQMLLDLGATFDTGSLRCDKAVLSLFLRSCPIEVVPEILASRNVNFDAASFNKQTVLHDICKIETAYFTERVELVIRLGGNVNAKDLNGSTPLHVLCNHNFKFSRMLEILVDAGADVNASDNFGRTPVHCAVMGEIGLQLNREETRPTDALKQLLARGGSVNRTDHLGLTPLHLASFITPECVDVLLQAGADPSSLSHPHITSATHTETSTSDAQHIHVQRELIADEDEIGAEEEFDFEKWRSVYWDNVPNKSLIPRVFLRKEDILVWAERARQIRGDPDLFIKHLVETQGLGKILDHSVIFEKISVFVQRISEKMAAIDDRFAADLQLSGSNYEGTKTREPDEFDFLFKLKTFSEEFHVVKLYEEKKTQAFVRQVDMTDGKLSEFTNQVSRDMEGVKVLNYFSYLLRQALSDSTLWEGLDLYFIEENSAVDYIPNLSVMYLGEHSREQLYLRISVDVVPCYLATVPKDWRQISTTEDDPTRRYMRLLAEQGCLVLPKNREDEEVQQVEVFLRESNIVKSLPQPVKDAYVVAKLLVSSDYCPNFDMDEMSTLSEEDEGPDYESSSAITSYMLKTALLHVWADHKATYRDPYDDSQRHTVTREWVRWIYGWIKTRTESRTLTSLDRPWEDLLKKTSNHLDQIPYVLAACTYILRLMQD